MAVLCPTCQKSFVNIDGYLMHYCMKHIPQNTFVASYARQEGQSFHCKFCPNFQGNYNQIISHVVAKHKQLILQGGNSDSQNQNDNQNLSQKKVHKQPQHVETQFQEPPKQPKARPQNHDQVIPKKNEISFFPPNESPKQTAQPEIPAKNRTHCCPKCKHQFNGLVGMYTHFFVNHEPKGLSHYSNSSNPAGEIECNLCSKRFKRIDDFRLHFINAHQNLAKEVLELLSIPTFTCEICGRSLKTAAGLRDHKLAHHSEAQNFVEKEQLSGETEAQINKQTLIGQQSSKQPKIESRTCLICGKVFQSKKKKLLHFLTDHYQKRLPSGRNCPFCHHPFNGDVKKHLISEDKSTVSRLERELFESQQGNSPQRQTPTDISPQNHHFSQNYNASPNQKQSRGQPRNVKQNGKRAMQMGQKGKKQQNSTQAAPIPIERYECRECQVKFDNQEMFSRHMITVHTELPRISERFTMNGGKCRICGEFLENIELLDHLFENHIEEIEDFAGEIADELDFMFHTSEGEDEDEEKNENESDNQRTSLI